MSKWISVLDEYPKIGKRVILFSGGVVQKQTYMFDYSDNCGYFWELEELEECPLLHSGDMWQPLPPPPEVGE